MTKTNRLLYMMSECKDIIYEQMLQDPECVKYFALSGAMVPAGCKKLSMILLQKDLKEFIAQLLIISYVINYINK